MAEPVKHRQTKGAATDMFGLQPPRHTPTLPRADHYFASNEGPVWGIFAHTLHRQRPTAERAETGPLRRGWREGELRTFAGDSAMAGRSAGQHAHPTVRSASSTDAFPRKVDGFLTR